MTEPEPSLRYFADTTPQTDIDRLRTRAVWLYFAKGRTQNEISNARRFNPA